MREIVPDVQTWSVFAPDKGYAFNGYAVATEDGTVLIDPPEPMEDGWDSVDLLAPLAGVCGSPTATTAAPRPPSVNATA